MTVRLASESDIAAVKAIADAHRTELGFVPLPALEEAQAEQRLLVAVAPSSLTPAPIVGFVHFRCCQDGHATIYEIAVLPEWRGKGVGKALIEGVINAARQRGCHTLRLKCPVDLPANGFYARLGFTRVAIEEGKRRPLAVWEKGIGQRAEGEGQRAEGEGQRVESEGQGAGKWQFFVGLTSEASQVRSLVRRFAAGYNGQPPFNPFERVIVSPLFVPPATLRLLRQGLAVGNQRLAAGDGQAWENGVPPCTCVMFDSGGFQVQTGRLDYDDLCRRLRAFYERERWAHLYVLPDHVPTSRDADFEVQRKIDETLRMGELFLQWLPHLNGMGDEGRGAQGIAVGVVHGRTEEQVRLAARRWRQLGVTYIAFGSFGTSGRNNSVNMLSKQSLKVLYALASEASLQNQQLHIFGITSPAYLLRLVRCSIVPTSFDSVAWWKAGGFGQVFLAMRSSLLFSHRTQSKRKQIDDEQFAKERDKTKHICPFCANLYELRNSRWMRILHNLVVLFEEVRKLQQVVGEFPYNFWFNPKQHFVGELPYIKV